MFDGRSGGICFAASELDRDDSTCCDMMNDEAGGMEDGSMACWDQAFEACETSCQASSTIVRYSLTYFNLSCT